MIQIFVTNAQQNQVANSNINNSNSEITINNSVVDNKILNQNTVQDSNTVQNKVDSETNKLENQVVNQNTTTNNTVNNQNKTSETNTTESNRDGFVYLTFDDGPHSNITPKVLDILKEHSVKATFFVINSGNYNGSIVKREADEGHTIGLHAYDHNYKNAYETDNAYLDGIDKLREMVKRDSGYDSKYIRFPGGSSNSISKRYNVGVMSRIVPMAKERGYRYYDWNVSSEDAGGAKTPDQLYNNVIKHLSKKRSNVVLMHDFGTNKGIIEALPRIIKYCKENGFILAAIDDHTPEIHHRITN